MGIVFRQSIKASIVYFAGAILGAFYTFLMAKVFTPVQAGITRNLITQAVVAQSFLIAGMPVLLAVYVPKLRQHPEKIKTLIGYAFLIPVIIAILLFVPCFSLKEYIVTRYQSEDQVYIRQYFTWTPLFAVIWSFISVLEMYLLAEMKTAASTFMREILLRVVLILLIAAYYMSWINLHYFVILTILFHLIPLGGLFLIAARTRDFGFSLSLAVFSRDELKELSSFAWYHLLTGITSYLMGYLDALILGSQSHKGLGDAQIYSVAIFFITFLALPYKSMSGASMPRMNEAYHHNNIPLLKSLFIRASDNMLIGIMGMWLLIIPNIPNATVLLKDDYKNIGVIVMILSIGKVTDILTGPNSELIGFSKYYKFLFRMTFLLVLGILIFDRLFIPTYGIIAAAWITSICTAVFNIIKMIFLYMKMSIHPFSTATVKVLISFALAAVPAFLLPRLHNPFADTAYRSLAIMLVYVPVLYLLRPSEDLNTYLTSIRRNKRLF